MLKVKIKGTNVEKVISKHNYSRYYECKHFDTDWWGRTYLYPCILLLHLFPYLNYSIMSWSDTKKKTLNNMQITCLRNISFALIERDVESMLEFGILGIL